MDGLFTSPPIYLPAWHVCNHSTQHLPPHSCMRGMTTASSARPPKLQTTNPGDSRQQHSACMYIGARLVPGCLQLTAPAPQSAAHVACKLQQHTAPVPVHNAACMLGTQAQINITTHLPQRSCTSGKRWIPITQSQHSPPPTHLHVARVPPTYSTQH